MSTVFFAPASPEPSSSYQQGLDQGHVGLTTALNEVVSKLPSDAVKKLIAELDYSEQASISSPMAEKIFQRAICVYQAGQLLEARQNVGALKTETTPEGPGFHNSSDILTSCVG